MALRSAGLAGMPISANPFELEAVPLGHTERAVRMGEEVFGSNAMVYHVFFFRQ
jgi:hypothetical protein